MIAKVLIVVAFLLFLVFRTLRKRQQYWPNRGMPGPAARFFFLHLDKLDDTCNFPLQLRDWTRQFGPIYGIHFEKPCIVISDVELAQEVLVKRFDLYHGRFAPFHKDNPDKDPNVHVLQARGLRWKRLRSITNPAFTVNSFRQLLPTVLDSISHLIDRIDANATDGKPFDIYRWYQRLTMDVISRVAMGEAESNLDDNEWHKLFKAKFVDPKSKFDNKLNLLSFCMPELRMITVPVERAIDYLKNYCSRKDNSNVHPFIQKFHSRVEHRREIKDTFDGPMDFIQMFLNSEAEPGWETQAGVMASQAQQMQMQSLKVAKKLTMEEIVMQCILFLIAGFDTTANTLSFTTGLLALHPEVQEKVIAEIDQQIPDGEELTYESVQGLKYLHHVTKEVLRLYPTASFVTVRHSPVPTQLGGHDIPAETMIFVDAWSIHYNKDIWGEDADHFRPERFDKEEKAKRHPLAWLPFGAGPRMCPGQRLGLMEDKLALVSLLRRYRFRQTDETHISVKFQSPSVGTVSPEKIQIVLERRADKY